MTVDEILADRCHDGHLCPNGQLLADDLAEARSLFAHTGDGTSHDEYVRRRTIWRTHIGGCEAIR